MRHSFVTLMFVVLAGCPGGDGGIGDTCSSHGDCDDSLQCSSGVCVARCARAPDCGDGYSCDRDGLCVLATGQIGDSCRAEVDCAPGLACHIDGTELDDDGYLLASCAAQAMNALPPGASCAVDADCRNGTCALGRCADLCSASRDCSSGTSCMDIPSTEDVALGKLLYRGCLPSSGNVQWQIPLQSPQQLVKLPVPGGAHSAQLVMAVDDPVQRVGLLRLTSPSGELLYAPPCPLSEGCDPVEDFFRYSVRHTPLLGQSTVTLPTTPDVPLETGTYQFLVQSYRTNGLPGSAVPRVTASVRMDAASLLDLHFHFVNFEGHMCQSAFDNALLTASAASSATFFQTEFLGTLRTIFASGGIALGTLTYEDLLDRPDLDGLDIADAGSLLELGSHPTGINVFFVRTLSPAGLQAFGPNPGPAGLPNTKQSGIVIGLDTLCYRSWNHLARLTVHEIARYMGLHHNVESGGTPMNNWRDKILDTGDDVENLMFWSEFGGVLITPGQRDILTRSGVLR